MTLMSLSAPLTTAGCAAAVAAVAAGLTSVHRGMLRRRASRRLDRAGGMWDRRATGVPAWFAPLATWLEPEVSPEQAWAGAATLALAAAVWGALAAPIATAGAAVLVTGVGAATTMALSRRPVGEGAYQSDLLSSLGELEAALASGASLAQALSHASRRLGPSAIDLMQVDAEVAAGAGVQAALDRWAQDRPGTGAHLVADALAIAGSTGGSQAGAIAAVAHTIRDRQARAREVRSLASQARASSLVLLVTPLAFAAAVSLLDHRVGAFLLATPAGWACLAGGFILDVVGAWWMTALIRRVR